ncbi:hypothetical protein SFR_4209 [Streptomyces sp. FR-008]|nr:hypothetical protein SFR_4209 [Streptomyces sp. FR-008]
MGPPTPSEPRSRLNTMSGVLLHDLRTVLPAETASTVPSKHRTAQTADDASSSGRRSRIRLENAPRGQGVVARGYGHTRQ